MLRSPGTPSRPFSAISATSAVKICAGLAVKIRQAGTLPRNPPFFQVGTE